MVIADSRDGALGDLFSGTYMELSYLVHGRFGDYRLRIIQLLGLEKTPAKPTYGSHQPLDSAGIALT